jgi:membrane protease YdiL (CAAX protease family)
MQSTYFADSRAPRYSILFAAPLLAGYEIAAWFMAGPGGAGVRNGADVILKSLFVRTLGIRGVPVFEGVLLLIGVALVVRDWRHNRGPLHAGFFPLMLLESSLLALAIGFVLRYATAALLHAVALSMPNGLDTATQLMISLGAGIYEELLFRVVLVTALGWTARKVFGWTDRWAGAFAVLLSALIFSAFHYIGHYGDTLQLSSFLFRFLAGLVFSTLYLLRGFGITAWTHALYDVFVTIA